MKNTLYLLVILFACNKPNNLTPANNFTTYTIQKGNHFADQRAIKAVTVNGAMTFTVLFDSSCIYASTKGTNQYDVNKLYGFSDGNDNHLNSARLGWSWSSGALHIYGYSYNNSVLNNQEITTIPIGKNVSCSIALIPGFYVYTVNGISLSQSRSNKSLQVKGYQQYPYFGGDEVAPHTISIKIKN